MEYNTTTIDSPQSGLRGLLHAATSTNLSATSIVGSLFALLVLYMVIDGLFTGRPDPRFELFGVEKSDWLRFQAKLRFAQRGPEIVKEALDKAKGGIPQVIGLTGPIVILPMKYLDEVRNHPDLSLKGISMTDFHTHLPGFDVLKKSDRYDIVEEVVRGKITRSLAQITKPVNEENTIVIDELFPQFTEWRETKFAYAAQRMAAQVSSRIFLGAPLCRNKEWLDISVNFTVHFFGAAVLMRMFPKLLRPVMNWILPPCYQLRRSVRTGTRLINEEMARKRALAASSSATTDKKSLDALQWMEDIAAGRPYDYGAGQLLLSFVSIHTTSMTLMQLLYDVVDNLEYIPRIRQEIIDVVREDGGWEKSTLSKLKLLDSCMKESQRLSLLTVRKLKPFPYPCPPSAPSLSKKRMRPLSPKPNPETDYHVFVHPVPMTRITTRPITLSDGTFLPSHTRIGMSASHMHSPTHFPHPTTFIGDRFLHLRSQPGKESLYSFASPSPDHVGFGYGQHACPGRFFAGNEIKLMFAHLVMKYEWRFGEGGRPRNGNFGTELAPDMEAKVFFKARKSEVGFG
ncbi:cytochrome P450 [Aulographum hederae CBS 113979]|uniref:Cytochrome P450 n=1 Tax=Aulographum hederae CBS 113979 TaxID=1176131 RepID=A0A6G1GRS4_9PEZI|nr:cytochrome P450 [Aulographum hederae CBS 113979]